MHLETIKEQQYFNFRNITPDTYAAYSIPLYLTKVLPTNLSAKILDIGCGFGQMMNALRSLGYKNVDGVDISDEAIQHCHGLGLSVRKTANLIEFMAGNREKYDFIIMSHVLEHIEKSLIIPYIAEIKKMLKKGGQFLVMVPNAQSNTDCYWAFEDFTHTTLFTSGSLYFVLMSGGFEHVEFLDPCCVTGLPFLKRVMKLLFLRLFIANKSFWNRVTSSSYHKPSPLIFSYEIKALAK